MDGPSFCWHCGGTLTPSPRHPGASVVYDLVSDQLGYAHRVHIACVKPALRELRSLTAAPVRRPRE